MTTKAKKSIEVVTELAETKQPLKSSVTLFTQRDRDAENNYQIARTTAHRLADKHSEVYVVSPEDDNLNDYRVDAVDVIAPERVLYTASPGTVTYMTYQSQCKTASVSPMNKAEWKAAGCKPLTRIDVATGKPKVASVPRQSREPGAAPTKGSTKQVWVIADEITGTSAIDRAAIIAACIAAGINPGTAAVQFAAWKRSRQGVK